MSATQVSPPQKLPHTLASQPVSPVRIAVVGCGAVARQFHLPVLAGHHCVRIAALIDRDTHSSQQVASSYGVSEVLKDIAELDNDTIDAAVIATPPYHHAEAAIDLMQRGVHVLVEKPMAVTSTDAEHMVRVAAETGCVLVVGHFRRLFSSSRLVRAILESRLLGKLNSFDVEEGHVFDWPSATLGSMKRELAGGGVLIDTGSHTLDQLIHFFGVAPELLEYCDNSYGGVESDCDLGLRFCHHGNTVDGSVELSRTRQLRNSFRFEFENATVELCVGERRNVKIVPRHLDLLDNIDLTREVEAQLRWFNQQEAPIYEAFRIQLDDWLTAIRDGNMPQLSGQSALPTVRLIDECYRKSKRLAEPWVSVASNECEVNGQSQEKHIRFAHAESLGPMGNSKQESLTGLKTRRPRILLTGASGFIGGRLAEVLSLNKEYDVRALVRRPASVSRLARLPVEIVLGDLKNQADVNQAVAGCDYVVHCAYGTSWGNAREISAVTVGGTRALASAALKHGVKRLVHLSTWAIHGSPLSGIVDETTPIRPGTDVYARTKAQAERVISSFANRGLPAVILRLTNVYGPYSAPFTIRPVTHLNQGTPVLVGAGNTPSNTVYVDNVVHAIRLALICSGNSATPEVYTVSDTDGLTWFDYHKYYADALGIEMRSISESEYQALKAKQQGRNGLLRSAFVSTYSFFTSTELIALAKRALRTDPIGTFPRWVLERFPNLKNALRRRLSGDHQPVYTGANTTTQLPLPFGLYDLYSCPATVSSAKAERELGFSSCVSRHSAMQLTMTWLRHARLLG